MASSTSRVLTLDESTLLALHQAAPQGYNAAVLFRVESAGEPAEKVRDSIMQTLEQRLPAVLQRIAPLHSSFSLEGVRLVADCRLDVLHFDLSTEPVRFALWHNFFYFHLILLERLVPVISSPSCFDWRKHVASSSSFSPFFTVTFFFLHADRSVYSAQFYVYF